MKKIIASLLISSALFAAPVPANAANEVLCQHIDCVKIRSEIEPHIVQWLLFSGAVGMCAVTATFMLLSFFRPSVDDDAPIEPGGGFGAGGGDVGGAGCGGDGGGGCH